MATRKRKRLINRHKLRAAKPHKPLVDDPTPEEIAAECADIQAGWSEHERLRRMGFRVSEGEPCSYEVPQGIRIIR